VAATGPIAAPTPLDGADAELTEVEIQRAAEAEEAIVARGGVDDDVPAVDLTSPDHVDALGRTDDDTLPPSNRRGTDETDLDETDLDETDLDETDLDETDLDEIDLDETDLDETDDDFDDRDDDLAGDDEERPIARGRRSGGGTDVVVGRRAGTATKRAGKGVRKDSSRPARERKEPRGNPVSRLLRFVREVVAELRKVIWPTRKELITYTAVVVVFVAIMVSLVALLDIGFAKGALAVFGTSDDESNATTP